jgi:hypothetical protein
MIETLEELRKLERRSRIYTDLDRRLMWPIWDNKANVNWESARLYCEGLKLGDYDDWRLPTIEELDGIQAMWSQRAYKTVDLIQLSACCPWSSTRIDDQKAFNYSFRFRKAFRGHVDYSLDMRALCVRDASDEISDDPKELKRERKLQKQKQKEREEQRKKRKEKRESGG